MDIKEQYNKFLEKINKSEKLAAVSVIVLTLATFLLVISAIVAFSAIFAFLVVSLWNFVVTGINHPELQVSFFVGWGCLVLLNIIGSFFRSNTTQQRN